ncbi:ABC transporter permease [Kumtagia ephedrae]|uniref:ABC transporter permease n=1 Tax=Kumtagia ephedrae TaxID=2116701 RepID=A0A2P7SQF5_9HYPH|nr:ABC transporter permease [Mesorhizobium ephedrae]PSJ64722.1 ABC transporter permease [Mesorhizobium ephedrae]
MATLSTTEATEHAQSPKPVRKFRLASWAPVAILLLLCAIIALINPNFLSFGNLVRISQAAMIPLVLGLGATFIILMGSIDLSVEGVLTLSAVMLSMLVLNGANVNDYGLLAVLFVLAAGAAVGFVNGVVHVRLKVPSFMTTLGVWFIGVGVANALLGGMAIRVNDPWVRGLAIERFLGFPWGVWLAGACLVVALVIQNHTRLGRHIYALGGGEELAALSGISVARVRILAFTLAGIFYAVGGILAAAQLGLGNAQIGNGRLFTTVTAVVVGGTALSGGQGGVLQTLVGVLIVVVLANGMVLMGVPPSIQIGVQGLMIIAAVAMSIDRKLMRIVK